MTGTPAAGLPANPAFNFVMPSIPGITPPQGMLSGPGGVNLNAFSGLGSAPATPSPMSSLGPQSVVSSAYNVMAPALQGLSNAPQQTLDQIGPLDELSPFGNQKFFPGSFEADQMMMTGVNFADQQLALPKNEFDQAQSTITQAKKAGNLIARGRDVVQHARNVKKAADVAKASTDVGSLLGNLGAMPAAEAAKQSAKTGVGQFIANAGASKFGTFLSSGAGAAASAGAGIVGKAIQELDKKDGNFSTAGAMGGGALQGAAIGSALGPVGTVVGGAVGAGVGLMQKSKFEANARAEEETKKFEAAQGKAAQQLAGRAILNTFPVEGIKDQVYNLGGETEPAALLEPAPLVKEPEAIAGAMPTALELAAAQQMNRMVDPRTKQIMTETHPLAADYIDNDLMNIGRRTWFNSQLEENPKNRPAWSAATVSKLMTDAYPGFKPSMAHAGYMKDVLFGDNKANFDAQRTRMRRNFEPGTVLTYGRGENAGQNFNQLKQTVKGFDGSKGIPTHGAVIVGTFTDANGNTMYQVQGGNESSGGPEGTETLGLKTLTAKQIRKNYPMALVPPKMKHGGHTNDPDYLAEGGEMIQHAPGDLPKTDNNGSVTPITKTIARINGDKHSASSGGVGMEGKESARIYSDQLHVPADLVAQLSKL